MKNIPISWLSNVADGWRERVEQGRMPHAVLLEGPAGVGKRAAAAWIAAQRLGIGAAPALPFWPAEIPEHADLYWVAPPEDKRTIGIDQVRELVGAFALTSYEGGGKVAVIEPANALTTNAANSLLKTLEEPPGDALIVLVADRRGNLPATIFSRCQRIDVALPPRSDSVEWLERLQAGAAWNEALTLAGNAPLAAIEALEQLDTHATMCDELRDVAVGRASSLAVAKRWSALDSGFVLDWLARQVQQAIRSAAGDAGGAIGESVLKRMDRRNLFCYLDTINRVRGQPDGSYNKQLTLESLLIDWSEGLANCGRDPHELAAGGAAKRNYR